MSDQIPPDLSGLPVVFEKLVGAMLAHDPAQRPTVAHIIDVCTELIGSHGLNTIQARRALLAHVMRHTASGSQGTDAYSVPASLEARIDAEAAVLVEQAAPGIDVLDSPLDGSPGMFEQMLRDLAESAESEFGSDRAFRGFADYPHEDSDEPAGSGSNTQRSDPAAGLVAGVAMNDADHLGAAPGDAGECPTKPSGSQVTLSEVLAKSAPSGTQRPLRRRVPAARRVAEELRREYAHSAAL
jgi:hypothetical protein